MAEGLLRHDGGDRYEVFSAGIYPSHVRPEAITVMREVGIDISTQHSKSVKDVVGQDFDYVITVCDHAKENCPYFSAQAQRIHWNIEDPVAIRGSEQEAMVVFRRVRNDLRERLQRFVREENGGNTPR
jgi:arsenate reductase